MRRKSRLRRHGDALKLNRINIILAKKVCKVVKSRSGLGRYLIQQDLEDPKKKILTGKRNQLIADRYFKLSYKEDSHDTIIITPTLTPKTLADMFCASTAVWSKWTAFNMKFRHLPYILDIFCRPKLQLREVLTIDKDVRTIITPTLDEEEVQTALDRMTEVLKAEKYVFKITVGKEHAQRYIRHKMESEAGE